jgi:putative ABC transport system permease protein
MRLCGDRVLYKNTLIKIKKSIGRYLSLFIIVMIGVGFFAGIRGSAPDILAGVNQYYKTHNLMDFRIVSTLGLTEEDVKALAALQNIKTVTPSYSIDALDQGSPIRIHAVEEAVNTVELVEGRMPQLDTECVADTSKYKVGDKIILTSDVSDQLKNTEFTVVGTIRSPLYMMHDYGNTTIGDGKLSAFIFVNKDNFTSEAYSEIYITAFVDSDIAAYSEEYDNILSEVKNEITGIKSERQEARYQEIYDKASDEISKNEAELTDKEKEGEQKLSDAKTELDENSTKLTDARKELAENEADLEKTEAEKNKEFQDAKEKIADGWKQINAALESSGISRDDLDGKIEELRQGIQSMKSQLANLPADSQEYTQLNGQIAEYTNSYEALVKLQASIAELTAQEKQLNQGIETFHTEIKKAKDKIADGKEQLEENEAKLSDGYQEYEDNLVKFNSEIADAKEKLADAKADLSDIEKAKWYIYDRDDVIGYHEIESATGMIISVADIMPIFFILIVMLMTSNTMARMIVEERGEMGTLISLGYENKKIIFTYLLYVLSATLLGALTGFYAGSIIIPKIIYTTFTNFILPPMLLEFDAVSLALIMAVSVILMIAVTVFFCHMELKLKPAALLRPVLPKHGQKILLERVTFLWKHLSFTWKVTMRNIFRYKQRVFMIIVGVAGCTALLLTGFGLRDSFNGVAEKQYGEILQYDALMVLDEDTEQLSEAEESLLTDEKVDNPLLMKQAAYQSVRKGQSLDTYIIVPEDIEQFGNYYHLTSWLTGESIVLDDSGVVITQKLAENLKLGKGDTIQIKDADDNSYSLLVSDVAENYIGNYIYLSKGTYDKSFGEAVSYNMLAADYHQEAAVLAKNLLEGGTVVNITFITDILQKVIDGNKSLDNVVVLLVVIAGMLAIIVLYNLTSINISERKREIATLKVLGFTDTEANQYIYREAFLLTLLSIGVGLVLGVFLHKFAIHVLESGENVYFKHIHFRSFVWSAAIILVVSVIMQVITYVKMKTIDMIESLKSVE